MKKQSDITKKIIQPLADRVLVKRVDSDDKKSPAGIIIPDTAQKEKSKIGLVVAVGPGRYGDEGDLIPMTIKVGSKVVFNSGWDNEVDMGEDDEEFFLVKESDILAVIK
ncbi:MAG: co-chaperone GroES [bacterium]|nr:co-chaperone GroES [bacterium]